MNHRRNNVDKIWALLMVIYKFKLKAYVFGLNILKFVQAQELLRLKDMLQIVRSTIFSFFKVTIQLYIYLK